MIYVLKMTKGNNLAAFYTFNAAIAWVEKTYNVTMWEKTTNQLSRCKWQGANAEGTSFEIEQVPMLDIRRL